MAEGAQDRSGAVPRDRGQLAGIARRDQRRAPMERLREGAITVEAGLNGDHKGRKSRKRAVTVLAEDHWRLALAELSERVGRAVQLEWTARRANLLVAGIDLPRAVGGLIRIGDAELEVTAPCQPCRRMDEVEAGLLKALHPDWRGGVTTRVVRAGRIRLGDPVEVVVRPPMRSRRLP